MDGWWILRFRLERYAKISDDLLLERMEIYYKKKISTNGLRFCSLF